MLDMDLADLMSQIHAEWAAIDFAGIAEAFQRFTEGVEESMIGWVVIGECYVKPIDWEELWLIEPQGVEYAAFRHHTNGDQRILVGTAATPAAAARLITHQVRAAAGEVDHDEPRITHGLAPRPRRGLTGADRLRAVNEQIERERAARVEADQLREVIERRRVRIEQNMNISSPGPLADLMPDTEEQAVF